MKKVISLRVDEEFLELLDRYISINSECFNSNQNRTDLMTSIMAEGLIITTERFSDIMCGTIVSEKGKAIPIKPEHQNAMKKLADDAFSYYHEL